MFDWLRKLFRKQEPRELNIVRAKPAGPEPPTPQPKITEEIREAPTPKTKRPPISGSTLKEKRIMEIRRANVNRRNKFSNSEHFKRRQPTTARKLWKPNAKLDDDAEFA